MDDEAAQRVTKSREVESYLRSSLKYLALQEKTP
jgi:hypothetical protein